VAEQRLELAAGMQDTKNQYILVFNAVHNYVVTNSQAAASRAEIFLA